MDWDKLKIFYSVAEAGSFTKATINLNLSQSAISRQILSLENELKTKNSRGHTPSGRVTSSALVTPYDGEIAGLVMRPAPGPVQRP